MEHKMIEMPNGHGRKGADSQRVNAFRVFGKIQIPGIIEN